MAYNAVQQGASGVDMGRNIFQSEAPQAMIAAVAAVVHKNTKPKEAFELFNSLKADADRVIADASFRGAERRARNS
jgi:3-hydroxy-5-phosphonooxypentane-2,4-dione thiolase